MNNYRVEVVKDLEPRVLRMMYDFGVSSHRSGKKYEGWKKLPFKKMAASPQFLFLVCYRGNEPVGILIAQRGPGLWNPDVRTLRQETLQAKAGTRAAYYLLQRFIDIGRASADHIITMIGPHTNIKPSSLKKLGFSELEILYSMEV